MDFLVASADCREGFSEAEATKEATKQATGEARPPARTSSSKACLPTRTS